MAETGLGIHRVGLQPRLPFPGTSELLCPRLRNQGQLHMWKAPGLPGLSRQGSVSHSKPGGRGAYAVGTLEIYFE